MPIIQIVDSEKKSTICNSILRTLNDWFGVEESIVDYVNQVKDMPFYAAYSNEIPIGFVAIKVHNPCTAEVCVMGIISNCQRHGTGTLLIEQVEKYCRFAGIKYLTVKTLADTVNFEPYERTRKFYAKVGFIPLEVFPLLWDEANPCLFLAKYLD